MKPDLRDLRRTVRDARRALPAAVRIATAESLAARLLALPFAPSSGHVAGYWAMDGELPLHVWQLRLPPTVSYCLPVLHDDTRLRFAPWRPGAPMHLNRFGIPEPDVADDALLDASAMALIVLPLVAFDAACRRVGMGGGWYDRTLAARTSQPAPPWLAGAAFDLQQVESLEPAPWDVALDAVCTGTRTVLPSDR